MIYCVTKDGKRLVILEPANLDHLRVGGIVKSPDDAHELVIAFTPDIIWTSQKIKAALEGNELDPAKLEAILTEAQSRPEIRERPYQHREYFTNRKCV